MGQLAQAQRAAEIAHVARVLVEAADAALAQNHPRVPLEQHVFGGEQELVEGRGRTALEENGQPGRSRRAQQRDVLHVACADLNHVDVGGDQRHLIDGERFNDDW